MCNVSKSLFVLGRLMVAVTLSFGYFHSARAQQDLPSEVLAYADIVLYNGKVLTADEKFTITQAVAVRDGKILVVGDTDRILKMAGPKTTRIDLKGVSVTPGFIDAHVSGVGGGHGPGGVSWLGNYFSLRFDDLDTGLRKMKQSVEKVPPGVWVFFKFFRTKTAYQVTRQMMDSVVPNNPALATLDNTTGIVNSKALSLIPDDVKAGIYKDDKGEPTGRIAGWAYGVLTYEILPFPEGAAFEKMVQNGKANLQEMLARGVTSTGSRLSGLSISIATELYRRGELPIRIRAVSEIPRLNPHTERYLKRVGNLMDVGNDWFKIAGGTVSSVDSTVANVGELSRKPKLRLPAHAAYGPFGQNKFIDMVEPGKDWKEFSEYKSAFVAAKYGWNLTDMHIKGDGAVEFMLDIWDEIDKTSPVKGRRFGMVHGNQRPPDLLKRLAKYDAALSFRPTELFWGDQSTTLLRYQYGADALGSMLPLRDVIDAGLKPTLEIPGGYDDDAPAQEGSEAESYLRTGETSGTAPRLYLMAMEAYVTRINQTTGETWGKEQAISREEALKAGTAWAARFYGDEKIMGTIEPGKLADLVVLSGDYMTVPVDKISDLAVDKVILGGKIAHEKK